MNKTIVIAVDLQNDFITGSLGSRDAEAIVPAAIERIKHYVELSKSQDVNLIFTRDTHNADYLSTQEGKYLPVMHCEKNTNGWQIPNNVINSAYPLNYKLINKKSFGYDNWKNTLGELDDTDTIELFGLDTDICVMANAVILKALYPETPIQIYLTACAGSSHKREIASNTIFESQMIQLIQ